VLSTEEIDRELDSRSREVAAMSSTMVELDNHPGLAHVRRYPPTGLTGQRWAVIGTVLTQLWEDLGRMSTILDSARAARARGARLDEDERAEITRLLRERHHEVARQPIPLSQREIAGPAENVEFVGLADTADRMRATYRGVVEFLDAVDAVDAAVAKGVAPWQQRLEDAGTSAPPEMAALLLTSAHDPLSLSQNDIHNSVAVIADRVTQILDELAELEAVQANWPSSVAAAAAQLDELHRVAEQAAGIRRHAEEVVLAGAFPVRDDAETGLRAALAALTTPDPAGLRALRQRIDAALTAARDDHELAQGLLDRRAELNGRLSAYQAKAARLGLGEDRDLLACGRIASGLLSRRPCDLRAVTRAVSDFQQLLTEKRGGAR
jgi:hypothetical protein